MKTLLFGICCILIPTLSQAGLFFGANHRTTVVHQYGPSPSAAYGAPLESYSVPVHPRKHKTKVKHGKHTTTTTVRSSR